MIIKYYENNVLKSRDMTPEELADWQKFIANAPAPEPTTEERIAALEEQLAAAKILLGLEE